MVVWGGLDFDTAELDTELREALAAVAPDGGALRGLKVTARITDALSALDEDLGQYPEGASAYLGLCIEALGRAQAQLFIAHEALINARRALGLDQ